MIGELSPVPSHEMVSYPGRGCCVKAGRPNSLGKTREVELALGNRDVSHKDPKSPSFPHPVPGAGRRLSLSSAQTGGE